MRSIDLNCDMGEGARIDTAMLEVMSSANIACGGHAGDEETMRRTVRAALARGVAIGAHPSYPDRDGFGRVELAMSAEAITATVFDQVSLLDRIVREEQAVLSHVKPHGALYHAAMMNREVAAAVASGVRRVNGSLVLVGLAGAPALEWWHAAGLRIMAEGFADRRYEASGSLRSRSKPDAMITNPEIAAGQAVGIAGGEGVVAADGSTVFIQAQTICVHSDSPGALEIARAVRSALERRGIQVRANR